MLRACRAVEDAGVPAYAIVSTGFLRQAQATRKAMGIPHVWIAEYPGVIPNDSDEVFERKIREDVFPSLLEGFAAPTADDGADVGEPESGAIVFTGTLDEVQDHYHDRQWTDGLPIVPPTRDRVERFLSEIDRDPDEVLGVLHPELREVNVRSVAVNGVMAGCRPEYMPVLTTVIEAIADPDFRLLDAGSTPGWEPVVALSGGIVDRLEMNVEAGMMRVGRQANSSIGRFLRMAFRNLAGFRTPPGGTDKGSIGATFNVAMGENERAVRELGWPTMREDLGFSAADDVALVQSVVGVSPPIYSGGATAVEHLEYLTYYATHVAGPWSYTNIKYQRATPLLVMSPSVAKGFAEDGWDKDDIRRHLWEHATIPARVLERYARHVEGAEFRFEDYVARGVCGPEVLESDDPDRPIRTILRPGDITIVIGGDPGRNQCRWYANNHEQGPATARRIRGRGDG